MYGGQFFPSVIAEFHRAFPSVVITAMEGSADFATDEWQLYDTRVDQSEQHDLAAKEPERLRTLVDHWFAEAERNGVFPLDDGAVNRINHIYVPWIAWRPQHRLRPGAKVHEVVAPNLAGGFRMVAAFTAPVGPTTAVL